MAVEHPVQALAEALRYFLHPSDLREMLSALGESAEPSDQLDVDDYVEYSSYRGDKPSRWLTLSREENGLLETGAVVEIGHGKKPRLKVSPSRYLKWLQTNAQRRRGQVA